MRNVKLRFSRPAIACMIGGLVAAGLTLAFVVTRPRGPVEIALHDVTPQTRIAFRHTDGGCGRYFIMETVSAGLALFDYDDDGLIDIYFLNGAPLPGCSAATPPRNALYRNLGGWRFVDVTQPAGVGDSGYALGVVAGDFDNDGDGDLLVNNYGPDVLYRNNGDGTFHNVAGADGTFADVSQATGIGREANWAMGMVCADFDHDGDTDVFVANDVADNFLYQLWQLHTIWNWLLPVMTAACVAPLPLYRPRDPQASDLWRRLEQHFEAFQQVYDERFPAKYGFWRPIVERSVKASVKSGNLQEGFARIRCPDCHHPWLLVRRPLLSAPCK